MSRDREADSGTIKRAELSEGGGDVSTRMMVCFTEVATWERAGERNVNLRTYLDAWSERDSD